MKTGTLFLISAFALAYILATRVETRPIVHPGGVLVAQAPVQSPLNPSAFTLEGYQLTRKAKFRIKARVLSREEYFLGREADLSPIDLALGWGPMSDQSILDRIDITQSGRWYRFRYGGALPITDQQIIRSSSNMHMIPAGKSVEKSLDGLREGNLVTLTGYLVDVDHNSGWAWRTSMTREDTGAGACEIVFVESVLVE